MEYFKKYEPLFGAWHINRLIGEGSFGKVFEIEREDFGKTYKAALKAITIPQNQSEIKNLSMSGMDSDSVTSYFHSLVENVAKEFELMSEMKGHSNIVSYEDHKVFKHEDGIGWDIIIRMELLTPADSFFSKNAVDNEKVIRLGIDLCKALEICQKHNVVHRDIKPSNIFVSANGDFKLGDFGVAKTIEQTTGEFSKKGTYNYMAPEVYKGESYGNSVDLYSVGIVMYRYLNNNRTPFLPQPPEMITYNKSEEALTRRMRGEELPPPVNASKELARIILKACSFDPANRYSSPAQLRRELENLLIATETQPQIFEPTIHQPPIDKFEKTAEPISKPNKSFAVNIPDEFEDSISDESGEINKGNNSGKNKTAIICVTCAVILALIIGGTFLFKNSSFVSDLRSFFSNLSSSTVNVEETTENSNISTPMFEFPDLLNTEFSTTLESTTQVMFVKTAGSDLNMREAADINSAVVAKIPNGYLVYVLRAEAEWTYIEYGYQNGWVKNEFLVDVDELEESTTVKIAFTTQPIRTTTAPTTRKPTTTRKVTTTQSSTTVQLQYTSGEVIGTEYVNEWANIRVEIPQGYEYITEYEEPSDDDLGIMMGKGLNAITVTFLENGTIFPKTEEQILNAEINAVKNDFSDNISFSDEIIDKTIIAGNEYSSYYAKMTNRSGEIVYFMICIREIENHFCYIMLSSDSKTELTEHLNRIERYS